MKTPIKKVEANFESAISQMSDLSISNAEYAGAMVAALESISSLLLWCEPGDPACSDALLKVIEKAKILRTRLE